MAKKKSSDPTAIASLRFGEARARLDEILAELESNEVDIDDLAERVKEAAALIRVLNEKLTRTRAEVEQVVTELKAAAPKTDDAGSGGDG